MNKNEKEPLSKNFVQQARTFSTHIAPERDVTLNYLLYLPPGYDPQRSERWPLVLFLHGSSMRGNDINLVKRQGLSKLVNQGQEFPFILVSPQCPSLQWWTWPQLSATLSNLLDEVESTYAVDPERMYVTGLSMGGFGTWSLRDSISAALRGDRTNQRPGGRPRSDQRDPPSSRLGLSWRPGLYRPLAGHGGNGQRLKSL